MFKIPDKIATAQVLRPAPQVLIAPMALEKMRLYVAHCNTEIGWLGFAHIRDDGAVVITDTVLFPQQAGAATCEITNAGLAKVAEELLCKPGGDELFVSLRVWGHSHVDMSVHPSLQDDDQLREFEPEWFIRIIANKGGDMSVSLIDNEAGLLWEGIQWEIDFGLPNMSAEIERLVHKLVKPMPPVVTGYTPHYIRQGNGIYFDGEQDYPEATPVAQCAICKANLLPSEIARQTGAWKLCDVCFEQLRGE